jgi:hypothetical protein
MHREIYRGINNHRDPDRPLLFSDHDPLDTNNFDPGYRSPRAWWGNNYEPNFGCQFEKRIGGNGDGPKWVRVTRFVDAKTKTQKQKTRPRIV